MALGRFTQKYVPDDKKNFNTYKGVTTILITEKMVLAF